MLTPFEMSMRESNQNQQDAIAGVEEKKHNSGAYQSPLVTSTQKYEHNTDKKKLLQCSNENMHRGKHQHFTEKAVNKQNMELVQVGPHDHQSNA